jgi:hypothetical protein
MEKLVQNQDIFGHSISINSEKGNKKYKTCIGGFFSILLKVTMFFYLLTVIILFANKKYGDAWSS